MNVTFCPSRPRGSVTAPPSKSLTHRALIGAALARGESRIETAADSDDVLATLDCLRALGAELCSEAAAVRVRGFDPFAASGAILLCRESGSTLRFLLPLCLLSGQTHTLRGSQRLLARPLSVCEALCRERGFRFDRGAASLTVCGRLQPGAYEIPGGIGSQFASGLLFALPLLPGDSTLRLLPPVVSRPYLDMTVETLIEFGVSIQKPCENLYKIPGNQHYSAKNIAVEGDWSNAAPFFLLRALGCDVSVTGLRTDSRQGDRVCPALLDRLVRGFAELDLTDCPDLGPVLFTAAALLHGGRFTGVGRLRGKESDRIAAMQEELAKCGGALSAEGDRLSVLPAPLRAPEAALDAHGDHRVAMALSVLLCRLGGTLAGAQAVRKSWPGFYDALRSLGAEMRICHEHGI